MRPFWIYVLLVLGAGLLVHALGSTDERVPYARFRELVDQGEITSVEIHGDVYVGRPNATSRLPLSRVFRTGRIESLERELLGALDKQHIAYVRLGDERQLLPPYVWVIPVVAAIALLALSAQKQHAPTMTNPALSFGKNRARLYVDQGSRVTFRDVAGSVEAKEELQEIVEFLKAPERFRSLGGRMPKGVLLVGPPGTGKTLLARAVAGEASVPFFSICGSEFVEMFVGVGAARVRDLFAQAREKGCAIIFVDELDAVGKARGLNVSIGGNDEREQTLNQLLTEMDGFEPHVGMIVLAATNRPEILDPALLRAGRFDRRVFVDRPDLIERKEILEVHARKVRLKPDVDLANVALQTPGLVGADLANIVNEAALLAARRKFTAVTTGEFDEAIERIVAGLERRGRRLGDSEKTVVAYHEAGHAIVAELLPTQDSVRKVSIIPRSMGALGFTIQQGREDRHLWSRGEIFEKIVVLLGGRVAEEIVLGDVSTGAQDDLVQATDIAQRMVRELGMSPAVGLSVLDSRRSLSYVGPNSQSNATVRDFSEATARSVDSEVARILADAHTKAFELLTLERESLERVAKRLFELETMHGDELRQLLALRSLAPNGDASIQ